MCSSLLAPKNSFYVHIAFLTEADSYVPARLIIIFISQHLAKLADRTFEAAPDIRELCNCLINNETNITIFVIAGTVNHDIRYPMTDPSKTNQKLIEEVSVLKLKIKELKKAEATHKRESEDKLRLITENMVDCVALVDLSGTYQCVTPSYREVLGYDSEDMIGISRFSFLHPDDFQRVLKLYKDSIEQDLSEVHYETRFRHRKGHYVSLEVRTRSLRNTKGKIIGGVVAARDITERLQIDEERKRAEAVKAELEARNRQLQKAESLGRMAGAIAHHFNNQLCVVIGNLELAMNKLSGASGPDTTLTAAINAAGKASEMSDLMLTYLGQTHDKQDHLDLSEICRLSLSMLQAAMPKNMVLKTDLPSPGPTVQANGNQIQQVLTNLVTNAWETTGDGQGAINITAKTVSPANIPGSHRFPIGWHAQENDYACLEVSDNGCGIADNDIEKLFDPFYSSKSTGRGLGLSVVLGILKAHRGGVTVWSEPGKGSIFRVFLPVSAEEISRQPEKAAEALKMEGGGTVLLVEDEQSLRKMVGIMLTNMGYTVLQAKDGVEAVEMFQQHKAEIRVVICDLTMPRMDGWGTLAALRKLSPGIPVILTSGYDKASVMSGDHPEWPQAFLGKPYVLKRLSDAIHLAMAKKVCNCSGG
jgi:PAS domain S-box-containing protein